MNTIKIYKVGDSLGTTFPKEVLEKMNIQEGDTVYISEVPGGIQLTTHNPNYDPNFEKVMEAYKKVSQKYNNALRELAQ